MNRNAFKNLLALGVRRGASDIHFLAGYPPVFRIRGQLLHARLARLTEADTRAAASYVLDPAGTRRPALPPEADRGFSVSGLSRFRVNLFRQRGSFGLSLRVVPFEIPRLAALGLPAAVQALAAVRDGLVLVAGEAGNGKSTTVAALLDEVNHAERLHVVTVEDPIEFVYGDGKAVIAQREVGSDTPSVRSALAAALRQDPDVVMTSDLPDRESADLCLKAVETGRLVLASSHARDATSALARLVGLFPAGEQQAARDRLADSLRAVVAQRLLPRADGAGLVPAVEVLLRTRAVAGALRDPEGLPRLPGLMEAGGALGMHSFRQAVADLEKAQVIVDVRPAPAEGS